MSTKRDLIVHYDEERDILVTFSTDAKNTEAIRQDEFPLEVPLEILREVTPEEAEMKVGAGILSLLDLHSKKRLGIRDYRAEARRGQSEALRQLSAEVAAGSAEARYQLALERIASGMRDRIWTHIEEAENLLREAAQMGHGDAIAYLQKHWQRDKALAERTIRNP